jgi:hypothetical protein
MLGRPVLRLARVSGNGWSSTITAAHTRLLAADRQRWSTH